MKKSKNTKRGLLASVLSTVLCIAMLIGSTFAWFTDSTSTGVNIIKSGTLKVSMKWADGKEALDKAVWKDASDDVIFDNDKWEPGYTEVRHIKISNDGNLALKYEVRIVATGKVSKLTDVIDVYCVKGGQQISSRTDLTDDMKIGTLTEALSGTYVGKGGLEAGADADVTTIALKMQESAGNDYQGLSIGSGFRIQLIATQDTVENDSFDNQYDKNAEYPVLVSTPAELTKSIKNAPSGAVIVLNKDINATDLLNKNINVQDKELSIVAEGETKTLSAAEINLQGNAKLNIKNVDVKLTTQLLVLGTSELVMDDGSLTATGDDTVLYTNGAQTVGGRIELNNVTVNSKRSQNGIAIYAPGKADYVLNNCTVNGASIFCAGNVTINGGTFNYEKKTWNITGDTKTNTNTTDLYEGKQYYDASEAFTAVENASGGGINLGDAIQFDGHREGYHKLETVTMNNVTINVSSTNENDHVFGIRYVQNHVEGEEETVFYMTNVKGSFFNLPN